MIKDKSIFIKNIYYMLSYAFTNLQQDEYDNVETEKFDNLHNLFAAILAKGISKQVKCGLYREYINCKEDLTTMRGKIDLSSTMQNLIAGRRILTCEYDELSENNYLNQILKTTAIILLRHANVKDEYKNALKKAVLYFANVDTLNPKSINWNKIYLHRNNQTYQMLLAVCQLILKNMLLTTDDGEYKLAEFIDERGMSRLYEKFILEYYIKECPQVKAAAAQIEWSLDDGIANMLPIMQSDVTLIQDDKILIIDAKYYTRTTQMRYNVNKLHSNNLYQIFTYVKNMAHSSNKKVSGMLLYARTDETVQPNNVYQMSGNKITVKTLDLNKNFAEISTQLKSIISEHFG